VAKEVIDLGDRLVLLAHMPALANSSGLPFAGPFESVSTMKNGSVISQEQYRDTARALEAAGLSD
jgi:hypothetical protein